MAFLKFLNKLLDPRGAPEGASLVDRSPHYEDPTGYYMVHGDAFDAAYAEWLKTRVVSHEAVLALGPQACVARLENRSGYVREFCLRALVLLDAADVFKPLLPRLNDYVVGNRALALQLTLKRLADLPVATLVDALTELDALQEQSRVDSEAVKQALAQRLETDEGRAALVSGLMHSRAMLRRACWTRCMQALEWPSVERIHFAMRCGDPAIARSVEPDVLALADSDLLEWWPKLRQVRAMPLRRAFLLALRRKALMDEPALITFALWDDSFSIRWLGRHWGANAQENLLQQYVAVLQGDGRTRHKRYAVEGLAQLKLPEAVQACQAALQDPNPVVRKAALSAACAVDIESQSVYVSAAMQDADWSVVREAFRQLVALGLPLPLAAIEAAADARQQERPFFELMLHYASSMSIWQALHLATFTSRATPSLQLELASAIGYFLNSLGVTEVYVPPTKQQWHAICAWMPRETLDPNSGLRYVMDIYAKRMGD